MTPPLTNRPSSTADAVLTEAAQPVDALDALLRQVVGGYFVLTDGQGAVSKWSEPAELLFARPAEEILGHGFFETLIGGTLTPGAEAWRGFLDVGEPPSAPGTVEMIGHRSDGEQFPMEAVFVPVKLDEGFDFSLFLEDLSFELPMNLMLLRMRQQHPVVVRALRQAIEPETQRWDGWRTAGTLVVFRPLSATPWVEDELARREAARAAADAAAEERLTNTDPGVQGSFADLDDAAAVVARLLSAMERIDELERVAGGLPAQLEEARRENERREADALREGDALRADLQGALAGVPSELDRVEQLARLERLERAQADEASAGAERLHAVGAAEAATTRLGARLDQLESERVEASARADARLSEAVAGAEARAAEAIAEAGRRFDGARAGLEARLADAIGSPEVTAQIEQVRAEHEEAAQAARHELIATLERLERDREREREAARAELAAALELVDQVRRGTDGLREQFAALSVEHAVGGDDRRRVEDLARETAALHGRIEAMSDGEVASLRAETAELRQAVTHQDSTAGEASARHEAVAADVAALRDTVARHEAAAGELAALRDAVAGQPSTDDIATLREAVSRGEHELAGLRDQVGAADQDAIDRGVQSLVGDTQQQIAALHARLQTLADAGAEVAVLRDRLQDVASRDELTAVRDNAAHRDDLIGLVGRSELDHLSEQVEGLNALHARLDGLAGRDELAALGDRFAARDELGPLYERLDGLAGRDELHAELSGLRDRLGDVAGRDEVSNLHERLDGLAGRDELSGLRERLDGLAGRDELAQLQERLDGVGVAREEMAALGALVDLLPGRDELRGLAAREELSALGERIDALTGLDASLSDEDRSEVATALQAGRESLERSNAAEHAALDAGARLELVRAQAAQAETEALSARQTAAAAGEAAGAAREDASRARDESGATRHELELHTERTTVLGADVVRLGETVTSVRESATTARADAAEARAVGEGLADRLTVADERVAALRAELGTGRERLDALGTQVDRLGGGLIEAGEAAAGAHRTGSEQAAALRTELVQVRDVADSANRGLEALRAELTGVRDAVREDAASAQAAARLGDERIEAMQGQLTFALASVEELKQGLSSAGQAAVVARREAEQARKAAQNVGDGSSERVTEVFQQILGLAAARNAASGRRAMPAMVKPAEPAKREPRRGFDDAPLPLATLTLEGKFRELNPAFAKLVGYQEHQFSKAAWPSPHDRRDYKDQLEQLRQLGAGELQQVPVQSTYMHGQGLMVPIVGTLTAVNRADGTPSHLMFESEDRHSA